MTQQIPTFYTHDQFYHGLVESKFWLCDELQIETFSWTYDKIYIIGSWTGLTGLFIYIRDKIPFNKIVLVDVDPVATEYSAWVLGALAVQNRLEIQTIDGNTIEYDFNPLRKNIVVCLSVDNIVGSGWFDRIPEGITVALQSRNGNHHDNVNPINNLDELAEKYPLSSISFSGSKFFDYGNAENNYTRDMIIGIK
jgi:hypothetical protein